MEMIFAVFLYTMAALFFLGFRVMWEAIGEFRHPRIHLSSVEKILESLNWNQISRKTWRYIDDEIIFYAPFIILRQGGETRAMIHCSDLITEDDLQKLAMNYQVRGLIPLVVGETP